MDILVITSTYPCVTDGERRLRAPDFVRRLSVEISENYNLTVIAPCPLKRQAEIKQDGLREKFIPFFPFGRSSLIGEGGILERLRENRFLLVQVPFLLLAHFIFSASELIGKKRIIIHAHWLVYCGLIGWALKTVFFWKDIRLIITIHGSDSFFFQIPFIGYFLGLVLRSCDAVTCVNQGVTERLRPLFRVTGRTMPMGVPASLFNSAYRCERIPGRVLFVGRVVLSKGVDSIISALLLLPPDFHLVIAGDGPYLPALSAKVKAAGLDDRVRFLGWIDESSIKYTMASASCLVLPSESEGFSLTVLEAMASELPVVGNDIPALRAQLDEGRGYLVNVSNASIFADAIARASSPDLEMIERARKYADQFRWERVGKRYRLLYDEISL